MFYVPGLLLAAGWTGSQRRLWTYAHVAGIATFVIVTGAWAAGAWFADGWAAFEQPFREAGQKGLTWTLPALGTTLLKPGIALAAFLPWTVAVPLAFREGSWRRLDPRSRSMAAAAGAFVLGVVVVQVYVTDPHRARARSLRPVAEAFDPHLAGVDDVRVGPVSAEFRHSSLVFYLRQRVRTFTTTSLPPSGSRAVLFSDEPPGLDGAAPFDYLVLAERARRRYRFALVEVEATAIAARRSDPPRRPARAPGRRDRAGS